MKPINIETLLSHNIGISNSYYRPNENELLEDYLKNVDSLIINDNKLALQKQLAELTEKSKHENFIIKGKLSDNNSHFELRSRNHLNRTGDLLDLFFLSSQP
jgi:hypothetical protein